MDDQRWDAFEDRRARLDANRASLTAHSVVLDSGERIPAAQALRRPRVSAKWLTAAGVPLAAGDDLPGEEFRTLETEIKYEGYLRREQAEKIGRAHV